MNRTLMLRRALSAGACLLSAIVLSACASGADNADHKAIAPLPSGTAPAHASNTPTTAHLNEADVAFAQMMLPHHQQAVQIANLAATRANEADIKKLAAQFVAEANPQITLMAGWLKARGVPPMPAGGHDMPGMPNMGMPGMVSEAEMAKLKAAQGVDFDRLFARLMISHHNGAIQMCRTSQMQGIDGPVAQMANDIEQAQAAEVTQLQAILDRL